MKHRILIAEEQNLLRQGLRAMIGALPDFDVVGEARDGKAALEAAINLRPDLVLLDLALPIMSGIEVTTQIKRRLPQVRVVALTGLEADGHVRETLRAGADGYVLKTTSYDELVAALRSVVNGKRFLSPDLSAHVVDTFVQNSPAKTRPSPWDKLTPRERSVLKLVAEGHTNRAAAEYLHVSPKTVEKHRASLMRKLGLRNVSELTLAALECGMIERPGTVSRLLGPAARPAAGREEPAETRTGGAALAEPSVVVS
ncbi:MAG TPA: response regulator transcription factor [Burkholderiaceae bacterium]|nr:response regulator transcription factor [Burkholderiaceae bacterium]